MVKDLGAFSMEVPVSNSDRFFDIFHSFHPIVTVLLEYLDFTIYGCSVLHSCQCNFLNHECFSYDG